MHAPLTPEQNAALLAAIQFAKSLPNIGAELCGAWVWLTGETYPVREQLKTHGFKWAPKKQRWFFAAIPASPHRQAFPMAAIREKYGSADLQQLAL